MVAQTKIYKQFFFVIFVFFEIFLDTHIKQTSFGQSIACYQHISHLLAFAEVFLQRFTVFAWGEIAQLVITGEIAQLIREVLFSQHRDNFFDFF